MATIIFNFNGKKTSFIFKKEEKIKTICQNFSLRVGIDFNLLNFIYKGNQLNLELTISEILNTIKENSKIIYILVYETKNNKFYLNDPNSNTFSEKDLETKNNIFKEYYHKNNINEQNLIFNSYFNINDNNANMRLKNLEEKINLDSDINNGIIIKYKNNNINMYYSEIKIFGKYFVEKNKEKCKIIYENKILELTEFFYLPNNNEIQDILEIKLIGINNINNMSYMFYDCESLIYLPDISKWNTINVTDMSWMFYNCKSLSDLPDLSKWNTMNVTDMSFMFYNCKFFLSLPDISSWDTSNVINMSRMFYNCESILSLPDISKWNTSNVKNMSCMFSGCVLLLFLPDISKWDTNKVIDMSCMFYNCRSLLSLPNISKWNINNVINITNMFYGCKKTLFIPFNFIKID